MKVIQIRIRQAQADSPSYHHHEFRVLPVYLDNIMFGLLPNALRAFLLAFLWSDGVREAPLTFELRHEHAVTNGSRIIFSDTPPSFSSETYALNTKNVKAYRPESSRAFERARTLSRTHFLSEAVDWWDTNIPGPDVEKRETLLQLAKMTYNSYSNGGTEWYDLGPNWNAVSHALHQPYGFFTFLLLKESLVWLGARRRRHSRPHFCLTR